MKRQRVGSCGLDFRIVLSIILFFSAFLLASRFTIEVNANARSFAQRPPSMPMVDCPSGKIWDGEKCRPYKILSGTVVVGDDSPVPSRAHLDEIERSFVRKAFNLFPEELFTPDTVEKGQRIQDIRLTNWKKIRGGGTQLYERTIELIINSEVKSIIEENKKIYGGNTALVLRRHVEAMNEIWKNSNPSINRRPTLKRVIIVSPNVLSGPGGGWEVVNDTLLGWWANDKLNGRPGLIPYDIDSRWGLDERWAELILELAKAGVENRYLGTLIDYGLLHELSHHLPVGDNYVYNFGQGRGFSVSEPGGKKATFPWDALNFMYNDHMSGSAGKELSAPSSYYINFHWLFNPKERRVAQFSPYPTNYIYGVFHLDSLVIRLKGLAKAGVEGCNYLRETLPPYPETALVDVSADHGGVVFTGNECKLTLDAQNQTNAFPGGYIGLQKEGITFPIYVPRNLMELFYWQAGLSGKPIPPSKTFILYTTPALNTAIRDFVAQVKAGSGDINIGASMWAYMDILPQRAIPAAAIAHGKIDNQNNRYVIEYRYRDSRE